MRKFPRKPQISLLIQPLHKLRLDFAQALSRRNGLNITALYAGQAGAPLFKRRIYTYS